MCSNLTITHYRTQQSSRLIYRYVVYNTYTKITNRNTNMYIHKSTYTYSKYYLGTCIPNHNIRNISKQVYASKQNLSNINYAHICVCLCSRANLASTIQMEYEQKYAPPVCCIHLHKYQDIPSEVIHQTCTHSRRKIHRGFME